jgi:hypothetical protein
VSRIGPSGVLALAIAAGVAAPSPASGADDFPMPRRRPGGKVSGGKRAPPAPPGNAGRDGDATHCAACHAAEGWGQVRFNHDRTGFPLRGGHTAVTCGACHPRGFDVPVADSCAGCHRDRHAGEFGTQCEGCHEDRSWRPLFNGEAHRRTAFPLVGKHGLIPCQQCHGNMRDRAFVGAPLACASCHQADYDRTRMTAVDHAAAGFSRDCQSCHSTWQFWPARLVDHDRCMPISSGPHHVIRCLGCHTSLATLTFTPKCTAGDAFMCTGCHAHSSQRSAAEHPPDKVPGYMYADGFCWTCHWPQM